MKIAIYTLGCKVNQYETQALESELVSRGHELVDFESDADAYVINTCTVTAVSDKKSRQAIRKALASANASALASANASALASANASALASANAPALAHANAPALAQAKSHGAIVAVCGCYAQTNPEDIKKLGVDIISGTGDRRGFADLLERAVRDRRETIVSVDNAMKRREFEVLTRDIHVACDSSVACDMNVACDEPSAHDGSSALSSRTRAMLKVQDGCVNFCTYCIIPYARGPMRSMPLETAVEQAKKLAAQGYRELVLTGIEISSYGADFKDGTRLADLIKALCAASSTEDATTDLRVRLGSLEPRTVDEEFCENISSLPNLCPQFHLSLQSGCDDTLRRMGRKYDSARYYESVRLLRQYFNNPAITTDLIVGFPGETEEEFSQTIEFIEKCGFASMHIFPYSKRSGTPAASMDGQLTRADKENRAARAAAQAARMKRDYLACCVGETMSVLIEKSENGYSQGHAGNYAEVHVSGVLPSGSMPDVLITGTDGSFLLGRPLSELSRQ